MTLRYLFITAAILALFTPSAWSAACTASGGTSMGNNWTMTQCFTDSSGASSATSKTVAWQGSVTAGHTLVAYLFQANASSGATLAVTSADPGGNTWTCGTTQTVTSISRQNFCYVINAASHAAYSITVTSTSSQQFLGANITEWSNSGGTSAGIDVTPNVQTGTTAGSGCPCTITTSGASSPTPTVSGDLIIAAIALSNGTASAGTGFTNIDVSNSGVEALTTTSTSAVALTGTDSANGDPWGLQGIAIKPPAGATVKRHRAMVIQ